MRWMRKNRDSSVPIGRFLERIDRTRIADATIKFTDGCGFGDTQNRPGAIAALLLRPQIEADLLVHELGRIGLGERDRRLDHAGAHHLVVEILHMRVGHGADAERLGIAGINDAVFLQLGDGIGEQRVGHFRIFALDPRIGRLAVPVEIVHPPDDRCVDEALHEIGPLLHEIPPGLYERRVGAEALVGDEKDLGRETGHLLDRVGLGGDIALHGAAFVREKRLRIGGVRLHLVFTEPEVRLKPLEVAGDAFLGDEQGELLEVLEGLDALVRMRHQHLRVLLEHRSDGQSRDVLLDGIEAEQRVGAHEEVELADRQQDAVVHVGTARNDRHIEAIFAIGAVDRRLVEAAVLAFRNPVGAEGNLVERLRLRTRRERPDES